MIVPPKPRTLFEKIWSQHLVTQDEGGQALLYVDQHLLQDGSAPAFEMLRQRGLKPRTPERAIATPDHYVPTDSRDMLSIRDPEKRAMADALRTDSAAGGIPFIGLDDSRQGIIHVLAPEQGLSLPGELIVCGDSHTSTHGALGALAFGIGAYEVAHVLATQTIWQRKPLVMRIIVDGQLAQGVCAKDLILAIIARIGAAGATGYVIEYAGSTIRTLSMEGRLTVCNMSIEAGARAGMIAPDDTTFAWLVDKPCAPTGAMWKQSLQRWRQLPSDASAAFDREIELRADTIEPMVTWGNSPENALPISAQVPDPQSIADEARRAAAIRSLTYMGLTPGTALAGVPIDRVFIGSCTNGRIEDLRSAARVAEGHHVASGVQAWVVPGSNTVKLQAEAEGLDKVFKAAGFEWRYAGCSMCLATNGEQVAPGQRCASTSNRNFVGRQGPGSRTHLMGPAMAAAAAVTGRLTDVRQLLAGGQA